MTVPHISVVGIFRARSPGCIELQLVGNYFLPLSSKCLLVGWRFAFAEGCVLHIILLTSFAPGLNLSIAIKTITTASLFYPPKLPPYQSITRIFLPFMRPSWCFLPSLPLVYPCCISAFASSIWSPATSASCLTATFSAPSNPLSSAQLANFLKMQMAYFLHRK